MSNRINLFNLRHDEQLLLLESILESATEYSIVATDLEGNVLVWNTGAERIYGYQAKEMMGKNIRLLIHPKDLEKLNSTLNSVRKDQAWTGEMRRIKKDGTAINVLVSISLRKDANNKPVGFTAIARDITQLQNTLNLLTKAEVAEQILQLKNKTLEQSIQQYQEASKLKDSFLANLSHELRTPLNGIIGCSELLFDGVITPESPEFKELLGNILTNTNQLLMLINDLLDLTKLEANKMDFYPELIDLPELLQELKNNFSSLILKKQIDFKIEIDKDLKHINLDPARLKQILNNYISNALKFTDEKGTVTVRAKLEKNNYFRLEVEDTGIGIKPEDLPKLFSKFYQSDSSVAKKYPGTGLGLALTKTLVEAQGGFVGVKSDDGKGSIFYAILPLLASELS